MLQQPFQLWYPGRTAVPVCGRTHCQHGQEGDKEHKFQIHGRSGGWVRRKEFSKSSANWRLYDIHKKPLKFSLQEKVCDIRSCAFDGFESNVVKNVPCSRLYFKKYAAVLDLHDMHV